MNPVLGGKTCTVCSTHHSSFINHFIKYIDKDLIFDRLQAGRAVVSIWGTIKRRFDLFIGVKDYFHKK